MKIDLTDVLNLVKPQPVELMISGRGYALRRLTIADVKALETAGNAVDGDDEFAADQRCFAHAATLFVGEAPPQLSVDLRGIVDEDDRLAARNAATAIYAAINQIFIDLRSSSKTYALASGATSEQIARQRAATASTI